ncbi:hypothetical protein [Paraburkholderia caffeinilytica]|uniref:hypothetical protein n=1 Tax=Paraburkholderia caffeinilytica TaxID=1761016 RepID=UPI0038B6C56C
MSTTIPLTLIEGSMALPRLRPLGHLPAPFGRDWALLPPGYSLRAELKALYAAVLRTFCLNAETIRALCQWESLRKPPAISSGSNQPASSTTVFDAPADESLRMSAETTPFSPVDAPAVPTSPRGSPMHWGALAGGACALGGAAMLASIAFGHLAQRHTTSGSQTAGKVSVRQEAQPENRLSPDAAVSSYASADNHAVALAPGAASSPALVGGASGSASASPEILRNAVDAAPLRDFTAARGTEIVTPVAAAPAPARAMGGDTASRPREMQRKGAVSLHEKSGRSSHTPITTPRSPQLSHIEPTNYDMPQIVASANAQQTSAKPSSAGPYSPPAPSQPGTDEYASVTLSAGTHLRNIAPPSRPASSINPPATSGATSSTEWINHMSQRRVTEVPDQFAK